MRKIWNKPFCAKICSHPFFFLIYFSFHCVMKLHYLNSWDTRKGGRKLQWDTSSQFNQWLQKKALRGCKRIRTETGRRRGRSDRRDGGEKSQEINRQRVSLERWIFATKDMITGYSNGWITYVIFDDDVAHTSNSRSVGPIQPATSFFCGQPERNSTSA